MDGAWRDKKGFYFLKNRQYGKLCTYGLIFAKVSAGILPLVEMLLTARFIDAVSGVFVSHEVGADIFLLVILWILVIGVTWVVNESVQFILCRLTQRVREGVRAELTRKTACLPYYLVENQRVSVYYAEHCCDWRPGAGNWGNCQRPGVVVRPVPVFAVSSVGVSGEKEWGEYVPGWQRGLGTYAQIWVL